jgi:hypothetical protein
VTRILLAIALLALVPRLAAAQIALDSATNVTQNGGAGPTLTFAHTTSGSNRILYVGLLHNTDTDVAPGCTYSGVTMTEIGDQIHAALPHRIWLFQLVAPATGSNNVVCTANSTVYLAGGAISYTGAKQTAQPDAVTSAFNATDPQVASVTTVADNSWLIAMAAHGTSGVSAGASTTLRVSGGFGDMTMYDSNAAKTPAGSYSLTIDQVSGEVVYIIASIAPESGVGGPACAGRLLLLGAGGCE